MLNVFEILSKNELLLEKEKVFRNVDNLIIKEEILIFSF